MPETVWREYVIREAAPFGLTAECLEIFDRETENGTPGDRAAWIALYEWDI